MNRSVYRGTLGDNSVGSETSRVLPVEILETSGIEIPYVTSLRPSGKKMIRITNKEIRKIKHPYYRAIKNVVNEEPN